MKKYTKKLVGSVWGNVCKDVQDQSSKRGGFKEKKKKNCLRGTKTDDKKKVPIGGQRRSPTKNVY